MKIICKNGEFDLSESLTISITDYNPFFNEKGQQSKPITLPATHNNLSLIEFSDRVDSLYKPISRLEVDIVDDVFVQNGSLMIHHADIEGISCTVYFDEGSFYSLIDEKKMADVPLDVIDGVGSTLEEKVAYLITFLKNEYLMRTSEMFSVFPVATDIVVDKDIPQFYNPKIIKKETIPFILNGFENNKNVYDYMKVGTDLLSNFYGERDQEYIMNNARVAVKKGYGMTAFVNVFYYLQKLFRHFGYTFDDTLIRNNFADSSWRIVIINNVVDAIYDGKLDLSQLLPDIAIKEFLKKISSFFAGVFRIDEQKKVVRYFAFSEFLNSRPGLDLTKYMSSPLRIDNVMFDEKTDGKLMDDISFQMCEDIGIEYNTVIHHPITDSDEIVKIDGLPLALKRNKLILKLAKISNIVHRNSSLVGVSEKKTSKDADKFTELVLFGFSSTHTEEFSLSFPWMEYSIMSTVILKYYRGLDSVYANASNPVDFLKQNAKDYLNWLSNGNMEISCDLHLPVNILYSLDLQCQHQFDSGLFYIDSISYNLPYDGKQKLTLRPFKTYADR